MASADGIPVQCTHAIVRPAGMVLLARRVFVPLTVSLSVERLAGYLYL